MIPNKRIKSMMRDKFIDFFFVLCFTLLEAIAIVCVC